MKCDAKNIKDKSWEEITKPLVEAMAKTNLKEEDVDDLIHRMRKENKI